MRVRIVSARTHTRFVLCTKLRNALLFGGTSPFTTLAALIIPAIAIGLTVASLQWLPKGLYLLLILGFGIVVQLQIPLFEHALKPYVNKVAV